MRGAEDRLKKSFLNSVEGSGNGPGRPGVVFENFLSESSSLYVKIFLKIKTKLIKIQIPF